MSVFSSFANCEIHLKRYVGTYSDGDNEIPLLEPAIVKAMLTLKTPTTDITQTVYPGVNKPITELKGYIIDEILPGIKTPQDVQVIFNNGQTYDLVLNFNIPSPFYNEVSILGTPCTLQEK